jgi:hypothetical protein
VVRSPKAFFVILTAGMAALALHVSCPGAQASDDLRVALVIGNAAYPAAPLLNPTNDARAMRDVLKGLGFQVIETLNANREQMRQAIEKTGEALRGRHGVGMLYYAGHGLQLEWHNYLVPVDAHLRMASDVPAQTIDVQTVIDAFKASGNRMNIIVLDACRDNPFGATASAKGLAPMDAPPDTLLAYATAPGNVAEDAGKQGGNGLYTQHLVQELKEPTAKIEDVFKRVRLQVRRESEGRQVPWESTSLEEDFSFKRGVNAPAEETESQQEAAFTQEKSDWDKIKDSTQADDFFAFLQKYPRGFVSEQAQFRLDQLQKVKTQDQVGVDGVKHLKSGVNRYALGDVFTYERTDGFTKKKETIVWHVTFADDRRVEINGGKLVFDQMGGVLRNRFGRKDPALLSAPADIAVGKRWRSAFLNTGPNNVVKSAFYDFRVVALEDIVVPMGRIKAYKVERQGWSTRLGGSASRSTSISGTTWIDPATMFVVRDDTLVQRSAGKTTVFDSSQIVSISRRRRPDDS